MHEENAKKIWQLILEAGDSLKGVLPDHPNHPKGRNPYAHISLEIKNKYGCSCLLYTSPSPRDLSTSRMPSSA